MAISSPRSTPNASSSRFQYLGHVERIPALAFSAKSLRRCLGVLWLADGLFQLQPKMFTSTFVSSTLDPIAGGQPDLIARNLAWIVHLMAANLTVMNLFIAVVQVSIGVLLLTGRRVQEALIVSIFWSVGVWYGGEGMNGLLTGQASALTGAPGAVLLYALAALALLPRGVLPQKSTTSAPILSRRGLRIALGGFWVFAAVLQLQPYWWNSGHISQTIASASGMGGLNSWFIDPSLNALSAATSGAGIALNLLVCLIFGVLGAYILLTDGKTLRFALGASIMASLLIWWYAQALGGIFTGMATDFNSVPLLVLIAIASAPARKRAINNASRFNTGRQEELELEKAS